MKKNKLTILVIALVLIFTVVGCTPNETGMGNRNTRRLTTQTRVNDPNINNRWNVDDTNNGLFGPKNGLNNGLDNRNIGLDNNMNMDNLNNGMVRNNNDLTNNNLSNNMSNNNNLSNRANSLAKKIADLPEVNSASVLLTGDTAIVGCKVRGSTNGNITNALKQKIEKIVKNTDSNIKNVSITADTDLYNKIQTMSRKVGDGNIVDDLSNDIQDLLRRITPNTNR